MERKTIESLRAMICGEIDEIAKKNGLSSHENLDILKDLLKSYESLNEIEEHMEKKEGKMYEDNGYSQRSMGRYYIDGRYDGNSYGYGQPMDEGNSYRRAMYDNQNSYMYYDPRYEHPMYSRRGGGYTGGYSMASKSEMVSELKKMMMDTNDDKVRTTISNAITQLEK